MSKYISLGQFNKKYFFILGIIIIRLLVTFISGFSLYLTPKNPIYIFGFQSNFFSHPFLSYCFQYFSLFLGGIIVALISKKKNENKDKINILTDNTSSSISLAARNMIHLRAESFIFKKDKQNKNFEKKNKFKIFLLFSLYYFAKVGMLSLDNLGYNRVKYWPLEFIFLFHFSKKILNRVMYVHQKLSLYTLIVACLTIYIINSFIPQSNKDCTSLSGDEFEECKLLNMNIYNDIDGKFGWFFVPVIMLIYLAAMAANAYSSITIKWFTDIKYISLAKILIYIGAIGLFYSFIFLVILSYISCDTESKNNLSYACQIKYGENLYYENFRSLSLIETNTNFYIDTFIEIPLYMISSFLSIFFEILIIRDLDPFYLIPIDCMYFLFYDIIDYSINYPITNLYRNLKFSCQFCSNVIAVFLSCIYFEILELHFCSLDRYLRRYIITREQEEKTELINEMDKMGDADSESNKSNNESFLMKKL